MKRSSPSSGACASTCATSSSPRAVTLAPRGPDQSESRAPPRIDARARDHSPTGTGRGVPSGPAYGKPRNGNWTNKTPPIIGSSVTDRGFTDHEHLDDWQLIHMNGRGYDYNLGRFLSVDPFIQDPGNSQSINGYSYIGNNPLSGTDPTGYTAEACGGVSTDVAATGTCTQTGSDGKDVSVNYEVNKDGLG